MSSGNQARLRIIVTGRVQGVFFRRATADEAHRLGISGWARNLNDGSVEIAVEGERTALELLLHWARSGPRHARVDGVDAKWEKYRAEFNGFEVR